MTFSEILHGCLPRGAYEMEYPRNEDIPLMTALRQGKSVVPTDPEWNELVNAHMARMQFCQETVRAGHEEGRLYNLIASSVSLLGGKASITSKTTTYLDLATM